MFEKCMFEKCRFENTLELKCVKLEKCLNRKGFIETCVGWYVSHCLVRKCPGGKMSQHLKLPELGEGVVPQRFMEWGITVFVSYVKVAALPDYRRYKPQT